MCEYCTLCWAGGFRWRGTSLFSLSLFSLPPCLCLPPLWRTSPCHSPTAPLQPTPLPSTRRKGLVSDWSVRGSSVCTRCLLSWANSSAAAVWARPGARAATSAPYQEQVRPPTPATLSPRHLHPSIHSTTLTLRDWNVGPVASIPHPHSMFLSLCACVSLLCQVDSFRCSYTSTTSTLLLSPRIPPCLPIRHCHLYGYHGQCWLGWHNSGHLQIMCSTGTLNR